MPGRHAVSGLTGLLTAGVNNSTVAQGQQDFRKKDCVRVKREMSHGLTSYVSLVEDDSPRSMFPERSTCSDRFCLRHLVFILPLRIHQTGFVLQSIGIGIGTTLPVFLLLRELHGSHVTKVMRPNKRCPRRSFAQDIFFT
ncbi:hypothetical protein J6590_068143 [Homalodisca vitripennis]|nr:hypothetical protein J6590_068143 [Homalodisca vitripennis]